jgi:hypothetical protein
MILSCWFGPQKIKMKMPEALLLHESTWPVAWTDGIVNALLVLSQNSSSTMDIQQIFEMNYEERPQYIP